MKPKTLSKIIATMVKYRDKPEKESLSTAESLLCLVSYFEQFKYKQETP